MNHQITISKRTALSAALCLALGTGTAQAASWSGTFTMYGAGSTNNSGIVGVFPDVTGTEKTSLSSPSPFFGLNWTAHDLVMYDTPGNYTINTGAGTYSFTVASGELIGHLLFNWGSTSNIDVLNKWERTYSNTGQITYSSVDFDCGAGTDGTQGCRIFEAFPGFAPNFDMKAEPAFPITLSEPTLLLKAAGQTITTDLGAAAYTFTWTANSDAAIQTAMTSANDSPSITIDGSNAAIVANTEYTVSVTATRDSDSASVRADLSGTKKVKFISLTLGTDDSDGDGVNDTTEGSSDSDGDGILDFLDNSNDGTRLIPVDTTDTNSRALTSDSGILAIGAIAASNGITNLIANTFKYSAEVTANDIGTTDTAVNSSCVGGCYDFKVTSLTTGGTAKIVIPLSAEIPTFPVYRKFSDNTWKGFTIDDNNSISSAAATGTGRSLCPAAGSSSYSNVGLTPGHYCVQLTIQDGGPNDADGTANGIIVDPGGVATTGETIMVSDVPNGCSMSTTPVNPTERADWWLVAGFLGALAWLRGMRRKGHAA